MKRITVYLDEYTHEDLFDLAIQRNVSVSELARCATVEVYEDDLDYIAGERGLREYLEDPESSITIEEFRAMFAQSDSERTGREDG